MTEKMLKDTNYVTILPFMVNDLGLKGSSLIIYAVIYSFSQDEKSKFSGSIKYLSDWSGVNERGVISSLESLSDPQKKYIIIEKRPGYTNQYWVNPEKIPERIREKDQGTPAKTTPPPLQKQQGILILVLILKILISYTIFRARRKTAAPKINRNFFLIRR